MKKRIARLLASLTVGKIVGAPFRLLGKIPLWSIALVIAALGMAYTARALYPVGRDLAIATYAERQASPEHPIEGLPLSTTELVLTWDTGTNEPMLARWAYKIVPFFVTQDIAGESLYPPAILFVPFPGYQSFVVWGNTDCQTVARVNERAYEDDANMFATLTHELIHMQGGNFCNAPKEVASTPGARSIWVESHTTAATLEVLAGMAEYTSDPMIERAFWGDLASLARRSLQAKAYRANVPWLYELVADAYWRTPAQSRRSDFSMRNIWSKSPGELQSIVEKYGELPWDEMVIPGICGERLQTGNLRDISFAQRPARQVLAMSFDDTRAMLGWFGTSVVCAGR